MPCRRLRASSASVRAVSCRGRTARGPPPAHRVHAAIRDVRNRELDVLPRGLKAGVEAVDEIDVVRRRDGRRAERSSVRARSDNRQKPSVPDAPLSVWASSLMRSRSSWHDSRRIRSSRTIVSATKTSSVARTPSAPMASVSSAKVTRSRMGRGSLGPPCAACRAGRCLRRLARRRRRGRRARRRPDQRMVPQRRRQAFDQQRLADRLGDEIVHAGIAARLHVVGERIGRHRDDRDGAPRPAQGTNGAGGLEAVHFRHPHVHEDDVEALRTAARSSAARPVCGDGELEVERPHQPGKHQLIGSVVLRQQNAATAAAAAPRWRQIRNLPSPARRVGQRRRVGLRQGDGEADRRSLAGVDDGRYLAAHLLDQPLRDGEPEPGAAVLAVDRGVGLGEFVEQIADLVRRNADAGVAHGPFDGRAIAVWLRQRAPISIVPAS